MREHFSRVKDSVLVAVQRRDAGRAEHEIFSKRKDEWLDVRPSVHNRHRQDEQGPDRKNECHDQSVPIHQRYAGSDHFFSPPHPVECPDRDPVHIAWF